MTHIDIRCTDEDIELAHVHWHEPTALDSSVWIIQLERGAEKSNTQMFNREEAMQLRDALNKFLEIKP